MKKETDIIHNPVRPGFYPDPSIVRVGNDYYMVNSSFLFFPCIPISHSTDLVNWETIGHAVSDPSYIDFSIYSQGRGIWAPDISYSNGKYYIVATLRGDDDMPLTHRQLIVWSEKPEGPYSKPVYIDEKGIDPSLFHDDDGKHYMLFNTSVKILPLSDDCLSPAGPVRVLFAGCTKIKTEGPHILKRNGFYYIIMAEGGTGDGHMITCARGRSLDGPFEECPHNPLLTQPDITAPLQRTGHGKFFIGPDNEWYTTFLCSRKNGGRYSLLGRETGIAKVTWDNDDWPIINEELGPLENIKVNYNISIPPEKEMRIDFSKPFPADVITYGGLYLLRQTAIDFRVSLNLSGTSEIPHGLILYYDMNSYIKFGVINDTIFISIKNTDISPVEQTVFTCKEYNINENYSLISEAMGLHRSFFIDTGSEIKSLFEIPDCSLLCDEGVNSPRRYVGPTYGVFGLENNEQCFNTLVSNSL